MPPCNFGDPQLWFIMAEATFQLAVPKPITASATKYNYCVANLSPEAAATVCDVITCPDKDGPYKQLKEELIKRCGESKSQEIRSLPTGEQTDKVRPPLTLKYSGPHIVKSRTDKNLVIDLNGHNVTVSIDRCKPAYEFSETFSPRATPKVIQNQLSNRKSLEDNQNLSNYCIA
ncbi:hypothetical protein HNY73_015249 [Argiope bruennichi]|uniref:DUF7041 domain-containing protein n=1 Tax=Argiope bruennichi TaxID=94029 RepID=A0A8T0EW69_ARGBR|nr:hypothetical protein HNY73_015249 [Argiope bruennichi]